MDRLSGMASFLTGDGDAARLCSAATVLANASFVIETCSDTAIQDPV
jgi:hypothetical protein